MRGYRRTVVLLDAPLPSVQRAVGITKLSLIWFLIRPIKPWQKRCRRNCRGGLPLLQVVTTLAALVATVTVGVSLEMDDHGYVLVVVPQRHLTPACEDLFASGIVSNGNMTVVLACLSDDGRLLLPSRQTAAGAWTDSTGHMMKDIVRLVAPTPTGEWQVKTQKKSKTRATAKASEAQDMAPRAEV